MNCLSQCLVFSVYSQIESSFCIYFFLYIEIQKRFIKTCPHGHIKVSYLKFNSQFSIKIIYAVHHKLLQINGFQIYKPFSWCLPPPPPPHPHPSSSLSMGRLDFFSKKSFSWEVKFWGAILWGIVPPGGPFSSNLNTINLKIFPIMVGYSLEDKTP